jgi:predicted nucleic acid-binding protein
MTLVVDASALVLATTEDTREAETLRARLTRDSCHAPHLIDAEYGNVLRRKVLRAEISVALAETLLELAPWLIDQRHDHRGPLGRTAWTLRANLTFYDALYVALAGALDAVLVTADARLAAAPHLPCAVDVVG